MESLEGLIIYGVRHDSLTLDMEQGRVSLEGQILDSFYAPHSDLRSANFMSELHDTQMQFAFLEDLKIQETSPEHLKSIAAQKIAHTTYIGLKNSENCTKTYMSILQFYEPYKHNRSANIAEKYATVKLVPKALILCMSKPTFRLGRQILNLIHRKVFLAAIYNYIKASGIAQSSPFPQENSSISTPSPERAGGISHFDVQRSKASLEFYVSLIFHYLADPWHNEHIVHLINASDLSEPFLQFTTSPPTSHYLSQAEHSSLSKLTAPPFQLSAGSLKQLFTLIPVEHLLELFRGLLLEQNILLIQSNYGKLGELMQQLLSLIRPLEFVPHAVRAFLTPGSLFLLHTALPALLGMARSFWNCRTASGLDCNMIYDVDEKEFLVKRVEVSKLCEDARLPHLELLQQSIGEVVGERERWIKEQTDCQTYAEREELWWVYFSLKIRQVFFNYLLLLVNNYVEFFAKQPAHDPRRLLKVDLEFEPQLYLSAAPRASKQFLKGLVDTNDFQYFLEKTYNGMHSNAADPWVLSFTKAVDRLRTGGGLEKAKLKADQDRQISELIARCKRPVLVSVDEFALSYCERLYARKQFNETSFSSDSDSWEPSYLPVEKIDRERVLEIRGHRYHEFLEKSKLLETNELMRQMQLAWGRRASLEEEKPGAHKRAQSKYHLSLERYRAAWQRLDEEVRQKKSELIVSVPEVSESSEEAVTDPSEVDISFKDARGALATFCLDDQSTKPSSTPYASTQTVVGGVKGALGRAPIATPAPGPGETPPILLSTGMSGGETPAEGTWINRDIQTLGTTQKKVVYADQEHLSGWKQEVHKLNSSKRLDFIAEEKRNIRGQTTMSAKPPLRPRGGFGRKLFQSGEGQENAPHSGNLQEQELLRHAQTQISKYDQRLQDFSPYKPEYVAQRKIMQQRIKGGNKAFKKLFSSAAGLARFYPAECESLVTKSTPRAISNQKLRATAQLREKIDFGLFRGGINTNSGAFQPPRGGKQLFSPSARTGGAHLLFKSGGHALLSPGVTVKPGAKTPQVETGAERNHIMTPKQSLGSMKHSMSSMNTPSARRAFTGKVLFKGFSNDLADTQSQLASAVIRPKPGYKTCVTKGFHGGDSTPSVGGRGPCTLGASIGSKFSRCGSSGGGGMLKSAFKPQASRKLFQSGQSLQRDSGVPLKYISSFTKTPFDKARKQELSSPHDDVRKELVFKNSLR